MKINVDIDRITLDDYDAIMEVIEKDQKRFIRDFLWHFLQDDDGNYIEDETEAKKALGKLGLGTALRATGELNIKMKELVSSALPPDSGQTSQ